MLGISLFGSGRMGEIYAQKLAGHRRARLISVMNPNRASAEKLTALYGGAVASDPGIALDDPAVDAVIISTPTSTHLELLEISARKGKAILCEKPLDLTIERVGACMKLLEEFPVPFMLGFNRRFDPGVTALKEAVADGAVGQLQLLMLTSRDPGPPPVSYVLTSGGYFADSTIHDIDLACWISGEKPVEVYATGSCLVDPEIGAAGDVDTSMTVLKMPSGCLVHVNNSRKSVYGFDQRIEAFGSAGMLQTANLHEDNLLRTNTAHFGAHAPLKHFFLERYSQSFANQIDEFVDAVTTGRQPSATQQHGRDALTIALAAETSHRERRIVEPEYTQG